jgi:hypothetical protein
VKICKRCGLSLSLEDGFHKDSGSKDGHSTYCKSCAKIKAKEWHNKNRARALENIRNYRLKNPDLVKAGIKKYYLSNRDICIRRSIDWTIANREQKYVNNDNYEIRRREILEEVKQQYGCLFCEGINDLEFHHVEGKTKLFNIGRNPRNFNLTINEIRKCIILCKTHHSSLSGYERSLGSVDWRQYPKGFDLVKYHSNLDNIIKNII